jgi:hypothetical protein
MKATLRAVLAAGTILAGAVPALAQAGEKISDGAVRSG